MKTFAKVAFFWWCHNLCILQRILLKFVLDRSVLFHLPDVLSKWSRTASVLVLQLSLIHIISFTITRHLYKNYPKRALHVFRTNADVDKHNNKLLYTECAYIAFNACRRLCIWRDINFVVASKTCRRNDIQVDCWVY